MKAVYTESTHITYTSQGPWPEPGVPLMRDAGRGHGAADAPDARARAPAPGHGAAAHDACPFWRGKGLTQKKCSNCKSGPEAPDALRIEVAGGRQGDCSSHCLTNLQCTISALPNMNFLAFEGCKGCLRQWKNFKLLFCRNSCSLTFLFFLGPEGSLPTAIQHAAPRIADPKPHTSNPKVGMFPPYTTSP